RLSSNGHEPAIPNEGFHPLPRDAKDLGHFLCRQWCTRIGLNHYSSSSPAVPQAAPAFLGSPLMNTITFWWSFTSFRPPRTKFVFVRKAPVPTAFTRMPSL